MGSTITAHIGDFLWAIIAAILVAWLANLRWKFISKIPGVWKILRNDPKSHSVLRDRLIAGVIAALIVAYHEAERDSRLERALLLTSICLGIAVWLVYPFLLFVLRHSTKQHRVFIIISAYDKRQFFADVLGQLYKELRFRNLACDTLTPFDQDYSPTDQEQHLKSILKRKQAYVGGLVVPIEPGDGRQFKQFLVEFGKPVVFFDVAPFMREDDYGKNACFVGCDNHVGGQEAARALVHILRATSNATPRILVIGGSVQTGRQEAFIAKILEAFPGAKVTRTDSGRFSRDVACSIALDYFRQANNLHGSYDGVFCTNDEMALGVIDALYSLPGDFNRETCVIGYDGIQEVVRMIGRNRTPLKNTVVQDTTDLAKQAVSLLGRMVDGDNSEIKRINPLQPRLHSHFDEMLD